MTDVLLFQGADGGEIEVEASGIVTDDGLGTAVFLSLFGGNEEDDGTTATAPLQWWGNVLEDEGSARRYRSQTLAVLVGLPLTSSNLLRLQTAAENDTAWLVSEGLASERAISVRVTAPKRVAITVAVVVSGERYTFTYTREWSS